MEEGRPGCPSTSSTNVDGGVVVGGGGEADGGLTVERGGSAGTGTVDCATFVGATGVVGIIRVDPVLNVVVDVSARVIVDDCSCGGGGKAGEVETARDEPGTKEGSTDSGVRSLFSSSCCRRSSELARDKGEDDNRPE